MDLTAIRSALGLVPHHQTRTTGKFLQQYILSGLRKAQHIVCVSQQTKDYLIEILPEQKELIGTVLNGLNYPYKPVEEQSTLIDSLHSPYYLHVGGDSWYKNRQGVLELFAELHKQDTDAKMVFVGPPLSAGMLKSITSLDLDFSCIQCYSNLSNSALASLYTHAKALLFPSLEEGFGWPIIEAQACGCPTSVLDVNPMCAIAGKGGIVLSPYPEAQAQRKQWAQAASAKIIDALKDRKTLSDLALDNSKQYATEHMIEGYVACYRSVTEILLKKR